MFKHLERMTPEEREEFQIDVRTIEWKLACMVYIFGLQKYLLKQDVVCPS